MKHPTFISAVGTPLTENESLHVEALEAHIDDQWRNGMTGVLVGGTMGAMQLLTDQTYRQLIEQSIRISRGRGEVLVGVGDTGFARTRERLRRLNDHSVDGAVVLAPYLLKFDQEQLTSYFTALADLSKNPLFLYDLPQVTGTSIDLETVLRVAKHPNIRGIKCSAEPAKTRQIADLAPDRFRIITAHTDLIDVLLRSGMHEHLDGIYAVVPEWISGIGAAAAAGDWTRAAKLQQQVSHLLRVVKRYGVFPSFTVLANSRGVGGNFAPAPYKPLSDEQRQALLAEPIVQQLTRSL